TLYIASTAVRSLSLLQRPRHSPNFPSLPTRRSSDLKYTFTQRGLENEGIKILPFASENIKAGMTIVAGNAFDDDQVEIAQAKKKIGRATSELQSRFDLVCRLLLEKKKKSNE